MSSGFARRQLILAALAVNAVKPPPGGWAGHPRVRPRMAGQ